MQCPACKAENTEGAKACASCGADLTEAAVQTAPQPRGRRLSKLALIGLIVAAIPPWLQLLSMESGGKVLGKAAAGNYLVLMALDMGANALYVIAIVTTLIALAGVARRRVRGGALALGGLLLAVGGMFGAVYAPMMPGKFADMVKTMAGGSGYYVWQTTAVVFLAAIIVEIELRLMYRNLPAPAPAPEAAPAEPAAKV